MNEEFIAKIYTNPEYFGIVKNTIRYKVPNISEADLEDCISEVYAIAIESENLENHPNICGWLNLTAKFVTARFVESLSCEGANREMLSEKLADIEKFEEKIEKKEQDEEFLAFLKKTFTGSDYKLYLLKFMELLPNDEIADIFKAKRVTIDKRVTRLKEKIRKILNNF